MSEKSTSMETLLRRILGLYFVITSLEYIPAALSYLAVENSVGPWWMLPVVPLSQAVIGIVAGLILLRGGSGAGDAVPIGAGVVFPPLDALLKLLGVYFVVMGVGYLIEPAVNMWFLTEAWVARAGHFAAAVAWLAGGCALIRYPQEILRATNVSSGQRV